MKRIIMMLTIAALVVAALTVTSAGAFAASGSERECDAGGGNYVKNGSTATCEYPPVIEDGKSQNPKFQKSSQTTETGQGNLSNKEDDTTTNTCSKPCPPGQFN